MKYYTEQNQTNNQSNIVFPVHLYIIGQTFLSATDLSAGQANARRAT